MALDHEHEFHHISVMPDEALQGLALHPGDSVLDGTLGGGGHAERILDAVSPNGRLLAFDLDPAAIRAASKRLSRFGDRAVLHLGSYGEVTAAAAQHGFSEVSGALLDLGVSSHEFDTASRGFSFMHDGPLDMRFSPTQELTAAEIVNTWPEDRLEEIFREYGEDRFARRIASVLVEERKKKRFIGTAELSEAIKNAVPGFARHGKIHPATRVFQALRIATNDELGTLAEALPQFLTLLRPGGRLVVISFHSLEDRIVKDFFRDAEERGELARITKKPLTPSDAEVAANPRARSAKLRIAEKR